MVSFKFQYVQGFLRSLDQDVVSVLAVNFLWMIPWGLIQPFLSPYFFKLSNNDYFLTGLFNGIPFATMIFSVFIFGWIVDLVGSKKTMIVAFILFILCFLSLMLITDPILFFVDYVISYSLLACFNPAIMKYASLTSKEDIFGSMGAVASLGYFFGSIVSGTIYDTVGMGFLFLISVGICVIGLISVIISKDLRHSNKELLNQETSDRNQNRSFSNSSDILRYSPVIIILFIIAVLQNFMGSFSGQFITIYFLEELKSPSLLVGVVFGGATLAGTFASHYTGKIGKTHGFKNILILCYLAYFVVWVGFFFVTDNYIIPALLYMLPIYVGLFVAGPTIVSERVGESRRGTWMGYFSACQSFGFATGTILGGYSGGLNSTFRMNFGISAVFTVILLIIVIFFFKEEK
ncbi:MAG: MFS transporter [Candidatus Heimdallarchaeota archaeon]|nr:MAG: MFS transporter [Candidatus Heimdallarchaeota archaeon]